MGEAARAEYPQLAQYVDVIVHIEESLDETQRNAVCEALQRIEGVRSAEFCPLRNHLMLISYDRERLSSQEMHGMLTSKGYQARLVGPI
jgi:hypothetical protein